jgi:hypothetical protein
MTLYGKTTKTIRHNVTSNTVIEAQRARIIPLFYTDSSTVREDGQDVTDIKLALGSRLGKYKATQSIQISNPEFPNHFYWGMLKFSWADAFDPLVSTALGQNTDFAHAGQNITSKGYLGGSRTASKLQLSFGSGQLNIQHEDLMLDDLAKHFIRFGKRLTSYEQRYMFSERYMRVPGQVRRANPYTFYGIMILNDNKRPDSATSTTNILTYDLEAYFQEFAL